MTPEDLVGAIRERLHEIEGMADAAGQAGRCGCHPGARLTHWAYNGDAYVSIDNDTGHVVFNASSFGGIWLDPRFGAHIALHDPSSVLRRVQADRRVLERHRPIAHLEDGRLICAWCSHARFGTEDGVERLYGHSLTAAVFPCDDLRDLAFGLGIDLPEDTDG